MNEASASSELELRQYRYFAVLSQELHFARAAERLGISQPALSQQLRLLERRIGARLLERNRRNVQLTEVGAVLRDQADALLAQWQQAQRAMEQAVSGNAGRIGVGYVASAALSGVLPRLVYQYRQERPGVQLELREMDMLEQLEAIAAGRLDVGFIRPPVADQPEGLCTFDLLVEPMMAVLRSSHPLARASRIRLADLRDETFICTHRREGVGFYEITMALCREAGFQPRTEVFSPQTSILISMVAAGLGVALVPASARGFTPPDVVFLPLASNPVRSRLTLVHAYNNRSSAVQAFVAMAQSRLAQNVG